MYKHNPRSTPANKPGRYLLLPFPPPLPRGLRQFVWTLVLVVGSNLATHHWLKPQWSATASTSASVSVPDHRLYLIEKAGLHVPEVQAFEAKVREIARMLRVPPEWLMAVMYAESKFDASIRNHLGSGAVGLIQFMPVTAADLNVSVQRLGHMSPLQQLEYVYLYLQQVRDRYGDYDSLPDLYLGVLYPKARKQDYCFTLYATPSKAYWQNKILDENRDGRVTVSDIDRRMQRLFPTAYALGMEAVAGSS